VKQRIKKTERQKNGEAEKQTSREAGQAEKQQKINIKVEKQRIIEGGRQRSNDSIEPGRQKTKKNYFE
jgi:hypothetical protein